MINYEALLIGCLVISLLSILYAASAHKEMRKQKIENQNTNEKHVEIMRQLLRLTKYAKTHADKALKESAMVDLKIFQHTEQEHAHSKPEREVFLESEKDEDPQLGMDLDGEPPYV